jgi:predicted small metal-binding protein
MANVPSGSASSKAVTVICSPENTFAMLCRRRTAPQLARSLCRVAPSATARKDGSELTWRLAMALRIICMCGYVIQGDNDDELWKNAQGHMGVLHPELVGNVTREDLLAQAEQL